MNAEEIDAYVATLPPDQILSLGRLPKADLQDLMALAQENEEMARAALQGYRDGAEEAVKTDWDNFLQIAKTASAVAGDLIPLAGLVGAVLSVAQTAKAL